MEDGGGALPVPEDLVERLPMLDALEPRRAELPVPNQTADLPERLLAGDDMRVEEPCHALDARRGYHRTAHNHELAALRGADGAGHDLARADAHPDVERGQARLGPPGAETPNARHHVDGRTHRPLGGVLGAFGHAEERDD